MSSDMNGDLMELAGGWHLLAARWKERGRPFSDMGRGLERAATELDQVLDNYHVVELEEFCDQPRPVPRHTGMAEHDKLEPHSHEVRADHRGVKFREQS